MHWSIILHPWKHTLFSYNQGVYNENYQDYHETGLLIYGIFM